MKKARKVNVGSRNPFFSTASKMFVQTTPRLL
ncbi:hypothetical protein X801_08925 [Opisthorchis viverrini]|uniref:Uncharacterized protein n=1 Tax=Opisthorchis viverrini TaxID=6198 RepID=A0A1S8WLI8_OPIVI|nr:hypothetical protein X801_08925 [Opisthorchis viverrini]